MQQYFFSTPLTYHQLFQVVNINDRTVLAAQDVERNWSQSKLTDETRLEQILSPEPDPDGKADYYSTFSKIETGSSGGKVSLYMYAISRLFAGKQLANIERCEPNLICLFPCRSANATSC